MIKFYPSLLSADFGALQKDINAVEDFVDGFHFDVMDGHFVPNLTVGAPVLKCLQSHKPFDAHLMIERPDLYYMDFIKAGAGQISIHAESLSYLGNPPEKFPLKNEALINILNEIKKHNCLAGIVFNPASEPDFQLCDVADFILIMSVNPGFGGQSFIVDVLKKIEILRKRYPQKDIQIDGGINDKTVSQAIAAGANVIISGSYFWGSANMPNTADILRGN